MTTRVRNARGTGDRLRQDLIAATNRLLANGATHESLSLRAVAREVGIAATSVYLHFPDKMALLLAVYQEHFARLAAELRTAIGAHHEPGPRLEAACRAYLRFADENPEIYHVLFTVAGTQSSLPRPITAEERPGAEAVGLIATVIAECGTENPVAATLCLWAGLHGLVTLRHARPYVPWPDEDTLLGTLLRGYGP